MEPMMTEQGMKQNMRNEHPRARKGRDYGCEGWNRISGEAGGGRGVCVWGQPGGEYG